MKGFQFVDFSKSNQRLPQFSKKAKPFRTVHAGYNYEAKCNNQECKSQPSKVICPMMASKQADQKQIIQNVSFDIVQNAVCPVCKEKIKLKNIQNIYFWNCHWEMKGQLNQVDEDGDQNSDSDQEEDPNTGVIHNSGTQKASDSCKSFHGDILRYFQWISLQCTILPKVKTSSKSKA